MAGSEASWAVTLPNQFEPFGNILQRGIDVQRQENQFRYAQMLRDQQKKEQDEWRKLNLIQDLTDLSKHQTGSDVANAIGNAQVSKIFQKYTQAASTMSPAELQASVNKDMGMVVNSMQGVKTELETADEQLKMLKQNFPNLDMSRLAKDYRGDILNRRLKSDQDFLNPLEVKPSEFNISDPSLLSKYVTSQDNLRKYFANPQGLDEMSVFRGTPDAYTKYTAKIPSWKKTSFDPAKLKGGFMTSRDEPKLQFKSSVLPPEALPSSQGQPFEVMDKDVYDQVTGKEKLELVSATRQRFKNYDQMNDTEKEYAQRNTLLNVAKSFDQTGFHPTEVRRPARTTINIGSEASKNPGGDWVKRATAASLSKDPERIKDTFSQLFQGDKNFYESVSLDGDKLKVVFKTPPKTSLIGSIIPEQPQTVELDVNDPYISSKLGRVYQQIMGGDVKVERTQYQTGTKAPTQRGTSSKYSIKGKDYTEAELLKMGYTLDQIKPYKQ